jgi:hypothetical protein
MDAILNVSILTKTYVTIGLVVLALFEFITAMYVFGSKGPKPHTKLMLSLHRRRARRVDRQGRRARGVLRGRGRRGE